MPSLTLRLRAWVGPYAIVASPSIPNLSLLVGEHVGELGVAEQRLGRDAADVEADAAPVLLLHDRDRLAELGGADRGDVATGAGAEDQDIEVVVAHGRQPSDRCRERLMGPRAASLLPVTLYAAYGTNLDPARMGERCPHSPLHTTGWLTGWRLTFGGEEHGWDGALVDDRRGPDRAGLRRGLRRHPRGRGGARRLGGRRPRALPQDQGAGLDADRRAGGVDLRARRLRGRAAVRVVPRRAGGRRRGRRRPGRLRRRARAGGPCRSTGL